MTALRLSSSLLPWIREGKNVSWGVLGGLPPINPIIGQCPKGTPSSGHSMLLGWSFGDSVSERCASVLHIYREIFLVDVQDAGASLRNRVPKLHHNNIKWPELGVPFGHCPIIGLMGGSALQHPPGHILSPTYSRQERAWDSSLINMHITQMTKI